MAEVPVEIARSLGGPIRAPPLFWRGRISEDGDESDRGTSINERPMLGAVVGTPEYMSPEQASFDRLDVDTRSDVYTLGVVLYEPLTGATPVDPKSLGGVPLMELLRLVREDEPRRPGVRFAAPSARAASRRLVGALVEVLLGATPVDSLNDVAAGLASVAARLDPADGQHVRVCEVFETHWDVTDHLAKHHPEFPVGRFRTRLPPN